MYSLFNDDTREYIYIYNYIYILYYDLTKNLIGYIEIVYDANIY